MKTQLFLLHFAGGNRYSYQFIVPELQEFEVIPLELPGRGSRISEELLKDFSLASQDIYAQIKNKLTTAPFLIYGHSMGALLALNVTLMLEKIGMFPAYLFMSGCTIPQKGLNKKRHLLEKNEFINELTKIGGMPTGFIEDKDLFAFFEPILRADFELVDNNDFDNNSIIQTPIYAFMGDQEENVEQLTELARLTSSKFNSEILPGGHFFIYQHFKKIAQTINNVYEYGTLL